MSTKKPPVPQTMGVGAKPETKPSDTKKSGTAQLPNINRAMILRLVETVKGL
jgi:hypothetical protein